MAKLRVIAGEKIGEEYVLGGTPITVGRKEGNTIVIDHPKVSRQHANVTLSAGQAVITDLGSSNGVYVNGDKIDATATLATGDEVAIGGTTFRFIGDDEPQAKPFIPGYSVEEEIAQGGMGAVYRAIQKSMDREVALKVLHRQFAQRQDFVNRFVQEARSAGKLSHPNIIGVHDVGKAGDTYYFTMELVRGSDLSELMEKRQMEFPEVCRIAARVADALDYAHQRGIVHRDIKPDNIMVTATGEVKLADLGIAKVFEADESIGADGKKKVLGTPFYMSPEQARGEAVDGRSDVYSLGCSIYHVLAGQPPFDGDSNRDIMLKHLSDEPTPLAQLVPGLPKEVVAAVQALMQKDVAKRVQTAAEASRILETAAQAVAEQSVPTAAKPVMRPRTPTGTRTTTGAHRRATRRTGAQSGLSNPMVQLGVFGAIVVIGLLLLWAISGNKPAQTTTPRTTFEDRFADVAHLEQMGDLSGARAGYQKLRSAFADNRDAITRIDERLTVVERQMKESSAPAKDSKAERLALAGQKAWSEFQAWEKSGTRTAAEALERLETLKAVHPTLAKQVADAMESYQAKSAESTAAVSATFAELEKSAAGVAQSGQYGTVIDQINKFIDANPTSPEADKATALITTLRKAAEERLAAAGTEAEKLIRTRNFSRAIGQYEVYKKAIQYPEMHERADAEIEKITATMKKRFEEIAVEMRGYFQNMEFDKADLAISKAQMEFIGTSMEQPMTKRLEAVAAMRKTCEYLVRRINEEWTKNSGKKCDIPFKAKPVSRPARIIGATIERGITLQIDQVQIEQTWKDIPPEQMLQLFDLFFAPDDPARQGVELYAKVFKIGA